MMVEMSEELRKEHIARLVHQRESAHLQSCLGLRFFTNTGAPLNSKVPDRWGLCHRLDVGTSGPLLIGKTTDAFQYGWKQIKERDVVKDYIALVHGQFDEARGSCRAPIDRSTYQDKHKVRIHESGDAALTLWEVIAEYEAPFPGGVGVLPGERKRFTLVHLRIITGRTHQIRVHLQHMGHPIVSDWQYGGNPRTLKEDEKLCPRIFLHKYRISIMDPQQYTISVDAPLQMDNDLWATLQSLRLVG